MNNVLQGAESVRISNKITFNDSIKQSYAEKRGRIINQYLNEERSKELLNAITMKRMTSTPKFIAANSNYSINSSPSTSYSIPLVFMLLNSVCLNFKI